MHTRWRRSAVFLSSAALAASIAIVGVPSATADSLPENPADPLTPATVTADRLPTAQINGVVWSQVIIGNTVYVGGKFTSARPAGSAAGTNEVARSNIMAYNLTTGALIASFAPRFNAQVLTLAASPDGSRLYVGGDFTQFNGTTAVSRIVALNPSTGALIQSFQPQASSSVHGIVATNNTVYFGGDFNFVGSVARGKLAAVRASDAALLNWAPQAAGGQVNGLALSPDTTKIAVGGAFTSLNGSDRPGYGLGVLDTAAGTQFPLPASAYIRNGSDNGSITSLTSDGTHFYASGYTFGRISTLEGVVSIRWSDLGTEWVNDCHGDTYSVFAGQSDLIYLAGHPHHCANVGAFPQEVDWEWHRGMSFSKAVGGTITRELYDYTNFEGLPRPELQNWFPDMNSGTFTGQFQGPWSVTGNDQYVVMGGEFTRVNGVAQQGLVRYTVRQNAPNQRGPEVSGANFTPTLSSPKKGTVRVRWQANWDMDNKKLSYKVIRDGNIANPVYTTSAATTFWDRPGMTFLDTGLVPGRQYSYRIFATDPTGVEVRGNTVTVTAAAEDPAASAYAATIKADQPANYWRFGESAGAVGIDQAGKDDLRLNAGVALGTAGSVAGDGDTAGTFSGASTGFASTTSRVQPANTFSTEMWFRTTTTRGGKLIGYANSTTINSDLMDRHLYMANTGQLYFGVIQNGARQTVNSTGSYNDGKWHHAVTTLGANGMQLFVDGQVVAQRADVTKGQEVLGYWRVGGDSLSRWSPRPTSAYFAGDLDEVAIYPAVLSAAQVQNHFTAGTTGTPANAAPTASFTATTNGLGVALDGSGSSDPDGTIAAYAWEFGDGATGSGATASHTYAKAGAYTVKLTVTDDDGESRSTSQEVTVDDGPPPVANIAADAFGRTLAAGWGNADTGGAWSLRGSSTHFTVADGVGRIRMNTPGHGPGSSLNTVSAAGTDTSVRFSLDKPATGGGIYVDVVGRQVGTTGQYMATVRVASNGAVTLQALRAVGSTETILRQATVAGLTYQAGQQLQLRLQVTGTSPTTVQAKLWPAGTAEPADWQVSATDSTAELQAPGAVGLGVYASGSATNTPVLASFDDLTVTASN
jgi:PKD repeat protein